MKKLLLLFMLVPGIIWAQPPKYIHNNKSYVDDFADIFTAEQEVQLDKIIHTYSDTVQISLVTVPDLAGYDVHDFAVELGNSWGVGGKSNNGVLILIAPKEHKYSTITGGGVQSRLTDVWTGEAQREILIPAFRAGNYYKGCSELLQVYITKLKPESTIIKETEDKLHKGDNSGLIGVLIILSLIGAIVIGVIIIVNRRKKKEEPFIEECTERPHVIPYNRTENYHSERAYNPPSSPKKSSYSNSRSSCYSSNDYSSSSSSDSSYSSSSDYGSSSDSSSSSSDFGGGSFDGGGSSGSW